MLMKFYLIALHFLLFLNVFVRSGVFSNMVLAYNDMSAQR